MQRASAKHRALGRSIVELDARKPPVPLPLDSVPLGGPLLGNGDGGGAQPSTPPNSQPAPVPAAGNGGSGGNGGWNSPTSTASPTSGGGTVVTSESTVPNPTSSTSTSGKPSSPSSVSHTSNSGNTASPSSPGGSGHSMGTGTGQSAPFNAESVSSTLTSAALGTSTPAMLAMGFSSQYSLVSGSNTASPSPSIAISAAVSSANQLSGGAIAGITIVCLFSFLALILLVVRRRSIAGRVERRRHWWFGHYGSGGNFSLVNNGSRRSHVTSSGEAPGSRLSARSSFATNFDQGLMLRVDSPPRLSLGGAPDFPPMAEVRERSSVLISTGGAIALRESMNSMLSNGSEPDAQYLTVSGQDNLEPPNPMSVRPFSPSESFVFPKPPAPPFVSRTQGAGSPRSSATLVHISTPSRAFTTDLPPASVSTPSLSPQTSMSSVSFSSFIAPANPSVDPFADPQKPGFADVEVIRRPFKPSLDDELAVYPGDRVHVLQIFDDGWASVEKLAGAEGEGLIPVDCLRKADQALPTFLTQKRVSGYGPEEFIATAL